MSITYTPSVNFGAKDSLPSNDPSKVIKGSEFSVEFTAIQTAFGLAAPAASPTFTGTVTIPTADINGGAIDGTVIGAATPAAGSFTTGQFGTSLNVDGTVTADGLTVDGDVAISAANSRLRLFETDTTDLNTQLQTSAGDFNISTLADDAGSSSLRLKIDHSTGDLSLYENTGTTPKFFWDASAESLGIGTTSPIGLAHLSQAGGADTMLVFENTSGTNPFQVGQGNDDSLRFYYNAGEVMRIKSDGSVGIGTSSPAAKLHLFGDVGDGLRIDRNNTGAVGNQIAFRHSNAGTLTETAAINAISTANADTGTLAFYTKASGGSNSEAMRIDSSGNVGIGRTPVAYGSFNVLDLAGSAGAIQKLIHTGSTVELQSYASSTVGTIGTATSHPLLFTTGDTERMRIDSSGNLLVGTTNTSPHELSSGEGVCIRPDSVSVGRTSQPAVALGRNGTNGSLVEFYKDGATIGEIGVEGGDSLYIVQDDAGLRFSGGGNVIIPCQSNGGARDNALDLGSSGARFVNIYATNALIQTSDRNEKQDIEELSEAERRVAVAAKGLLRKFRWKEAVAEKGDDARIHFGIIAQDLQAAFEAEGLDAGRYGMFIHSTWTDEETGEDRSRMGVRYSELLAFIIAAL